MLQDQSRNRTPMPGAQAPAATPPDTRPARAEAGIAAMLAAEAPLALPAQMSIESDPIFVAIKECERLEAVCTAEYAKGNDGNPTPTQEAACDAVWNFVSGPMSETVPTTAAGCVALARFIPKLFARWASTLDSETPRALFRLIERSPVCTSPGPAPMAAAELPAPGSPEAMAAFSAACRAVDAASFLDEAEAKALKIGSGLQYWTSDVVEAARMGNFSRIMPQDVEAARATSPARLRELLVLALRRELRMAEAEQASRLHELHALAYPDDQEEVTDTAPTGDAVDLAIEAHRSARAALTAACNPADSVWVEQNGGDTSDEAMAPARAIHEAASDAETDAWDALLETRPSDPDGLLQMLRYIGGAGPMEVLGDAREFGRNIAEAAEAALRSAIDADAELMALGGQFDRLHAAWLVAVEAAREPGERFDAFMEAAKARGGPTMKDIEAVWALPGVKETHDAEETAFAALSQLGDDILQRPARTVQGLAVQARATIPQVWPGGTFEADAALAPDEDVDKETVRAFIESCCALAGIDWRGRPSAASQVEPSKPDSASASAPDPVHALIAEHRAAYAKWDRLSKVWNEMVPDSPGFAEAVEACDAPSEREVAALQALLTARPTTLAGIVALAAYLPDALRQVDPSNEESDGEVALRSIAMALRALGGVGMPDAGLAAALLDRRAKAGEFLNLMQRDGFVPYPADAPRCLMAIDLAIPLEAERLLRIAQAEFDRLADAYVNFPPAEREAHLVRLRAEYRLDELAAVVGGWATAPEPVASDPIFTGIAEARAALDRTSAAYAAHRQQQPDADLPEAYYAPFRQTVSAFFDRVLSIEPTTDAGRRAVAQLALDISTTLELNFEPKEAVAILRRLAGGPVDAGAVQKPSLADQILDGWRAWGGRPDLDESAAGQAEFDRLSEMRNALIDAAEALPATTENILPKALACAWLDYVQLWGHGLTREDYGSDGRLALDIDTAICGRLKTRYNGVAA